MKEGIAYMKYKKIGTIKRKIQDILGTNYENVDIKIDDVGLKKHIEKRQHHEALKYYDSIQEILDNPDYIGINPNEKDKSLEYVKVYEDNILIGVKIHPSNHFFYIPSMYKITDRKLQNRLYSQRLIPFDNNTEK